MHSLAQLNNYSITSLEFQDERTPAIVYSTDSVVNPTITLSEGQTHTAQLGTNIVELINQNSANLVYRIDVSALSNVTVTWDSLPGNVAVSNTAGVYTVTGINTVTEWNQVKSPIVTLPTVDYNGIWSYTSSVLFFGIVDRTWTTTVTVTDTPEITSPSSYYYTPGTPAVILHTPQVLDTTATSYTITCSPSDANLITSITSNASGGTTSTNSTTKVVTITGNKTQVNAHLANITLSIAGNVDSDFNLNYSLTNSPSGLVSNVAQQVWSLSDSVLQRGSASYYNEDNTGPVTNTPIIVDVFNSNVNQQYTLLVNPTTTSAVANLTTNGTTATVSWNNTTKTLSLIGTKSQVNSALGNLTLTPTIDYVSDFYLNYRLGGNVTVTTIQDALWSSVEFLIQANTSSTNNTIDSSDNHYTPATVRSNIVGNAVSVNSSFTNKWGSTVFLDPQLVYNMNSNLELTNVANWCWEGWFYFNDHVSGNAVPWRDILIDYGRDQTGTVGTANTTQSKVQLNHVQSSDGTHTFNVVWRTNSVANSGQISTRVYSSAEATGRWIHLAMTFEGSKLNLFVDGVRETVSTTISGTFTTTPLKLNIGTGVYWLPGYIETYYIQNGDFDGLADDIRFTRGSARYTQNFTVPSARFYPGLSTSNIEFAASVSKLQPILLNQIDNEINNMNVSRSFVQNTPDYMFISQIPNIPAQGNVDDIYTIKFSSSAGRFGISDSNVVDTYSFSGTRTACNNQFSLIKFYPLRDVFGSQIVVYTQYVNGVQQLVQQINTVGAQRTTTLPDQDTYIFTSNGNFTPTYTQREYLNFAITLVGGGYGGGSSTNYNGGAGGKVVQLVSQTSNTFLNVNQTYPVTIGQGGGYYIPGPRGGTPGTPGVAPTASTMFNLTSATGTASTGSGPISVVNGLRYGGAGGSNPNYSYSVGKGATLGGGNAYAYQARHSTAGTPGTGGGGGGGATYSGADPAFWPSAGGSGVVAIKFYR